MEEKKKEEWKKHLRKAAMLFFLTQGVLCTLWTGRKLILRVLAGEGLPPGGTEAEFTLNEGRESRTEEEFASSPESPKGQETGLPPERGRTAETTGAQKSDVMQEISAAPKGGPETETSPAAETNSISESTSASESGQSSETALAAETGLGSETDPASGNAQGTETGPASGKAQGTETGFATENPQGAENAQTSETPAGAETLQPAEVASAAETAPAEGEAAPASEGEASPAPEGEVVNEAAPAPEGEAVYEAAPAYEAEPVYEAEPAYEAAVEPEPVYEPEPAPSRGEIPWQGENSSSLGQAGCDRIRAGVSAAAAGIGAAYSQDLQNAAILRAAGGNGSAMDILTAYGGEGWRSYAWRECVSYAYLLSASEEGYAELIASLNAGWEGLVSAGEGWSEYGVGVDVVEADGAWLVTVVLVFTKAG